MSDEIAVSGTQINVPDTFERKDLIGGVIRKHNKFLGEYNSEMNELGTKMQELQNNIDSLKKNREDTLEKIEILAEKRQLFYHQAEKVLEELEAELSENADILKDLSHIKEKLSKVKGSLTVEEEQKQVDSILQAISSVSSTVPANKGNFTVMGERIKEALSSKTELVSIDSSEENYNNTISSYEKEIGEISPRHKWLENRIQSHQEALKYWEGQPLVDDMEEVSA